MKLEVVEVAGEDRLPFRLVLTEDDDVKTDLGIRFRTEHAAKRTAGRFLRPERLESLPGKVARAKAKPIAKVAAKVKAADEAVAKAKVVLDAALKAQAEAEAAAKE